MKVKSLLLFLLLFLYAEAAIAQKTKVMIVGFFHFASNNDAVKFERENMLSDKRQKEIEDLNLSLSKFQPDKIFIEWPPRRQGYVDSVYKEYRAGRFPLTANEIYQVGFRLASRLNHATLYCMDAPGQYLFDTLLSTPQKAQVEAYFEKMSKFAMQQDSEQKLLTVKERIRSMNTKAAILETHNFNTVTELAPYLGKVGDYAGAEFMGEWYKRNIRMYSNIVRQLKPSDKTILIIVGAGHARIISHFFEDNPAFEVVDVLKYLK